MKAIEIIKTLQAEQVQQLLNENYPDDVVAVSQFVQILDSGSAMFQCTAEEESTDFFFVYVTFDAASGEFRADY